MTAATFKGCKFDPDAGVIYADDGTQYPIFTMVNVKDMIATIAKTFDVNTTRFLIIRCAEHDWRCIDLEGYEIHRSQ